MDIKMHQDKKSVLDINSTSIKSSNNKKTKNSTTYFLSSLGIRMPFWSPAAGNNLCVL